MKYGLGIDAGGTYTDSVIYDFETKEVICYAKSITDKEDLKRGINEGLEQLPKELIGQVELVALSTTLATNACVEGKGSRAILILIGCDRQTTSKYGRQYGLPDVNEIIFIEGGHTYDGDVSMEPDWNILKEEVLKRRQNADSFAIVELSGMMNPEYEIKARDIVSELTGMPVVYANEVTRELNFMKRAASVLINAQLIPLINEFLDAVRANLEKREINAPMVIVRGDGSLMSEEFARRMPVETLLSGPAASVIGAMKLSGRQDCLVVDMGGTTSDFAIIEKDMIKFADRGINIGKWQTGTRSIAMKPVGLGGDSLITFDRYDNLVISPFRVAPLSYLAHKWPSVLDEMQEIYMESRVHTNSLCEFFYLVKDISSYSYYDEREEAIVKALKDGPLSITKLAEKAGTTIYEMRFKRLEQNGIIMRSGLTPTDIMHLSGDFAAWSTEGARLGASIMSDRLGKSIKTLIDDITKMVKKKLYLNIVKLLMENEDKEYKYEEISEKLEQLILKGYNGTDNKSNRKKSLRIGLSTEFALIGIGAPIHVYLPDVAKALNTECVIPKNAGVANAVGAITGDIRGEETVVIKPVYNGVDAGAYNCHTSREKRVFSKYNEALEWAKEEAERLAKSSAKTRGAGDVRIIVDVKESSITLSSSEVVEDECSVLLETIVTAMATGMLRCWA